MSAANYTALFEDDRAAFEDSEPYVDNSSPADPLVVFGQGGTVYEACLFDSVGAVCIVYAADGSFVYNDELPGTERFLLEGLGCSPERTATIMRLLQKNPAKD